MSWELWGLVAGGLCVLGIYSFLYKENPVYRIFEHIFIGVATGYGVVMLVSNWAWPRWLKPYALDLERAPWESYHWINVLWFLPAIFGLLIYFIFSRKRAWVAQLVIGVGLGQAGGFAFRGVFSEFMPQLVDSFRPLLALHPGPAGAGGVDWWLSFQNVLFALTLVCVMIYFFFSFEHDKPGIRQASSLGRWLLMVTFGAFFGSTVMARMALLIDRLQFMTKGWLDAIGTLIGGG